MTAAVLRPDRSGYRRFPHSNALLTSVASLNRLLDERGQTGREQVAALAMSYMVHLIAFLAAVLILRHKPPPAVTEFGVMPVHSVLGTPDGEPGAPAIVVPQPRPSRQDPAPAAVAAPTPRARPTPQPQPTAARREVTRATPKPQATKAKATTRQNDARTSDTSTADVLASSAANAASDARAAANAELLTRRGSRGTPTGILGGQDGGGLGTLMFTNQWYVIQVRDIVYTNWANPFAGRTQPATQLKVTVEFRIQRDGSIVDARVEQSSGNENYDRSGLRAVQHARLPALPKDYPGRDVQVSFEFLSSAE